MKISQMLMYFLSSFVSELSKTKNKSNVSKSQVSNSKFNKTSQFKGMDTIQKLTKILSISVE